jgi:hypothetical protein
MVFGCLVGTKIEGVLGCGEFRVAGGVLSSGSPHVKQNLLSSAFLFPQDGQNID